MEHDHLQGEHTAAVVLNRTVVDSDGHFSTLCGSVVIFRENSMYYQLSHDTTHFDSGY